VPIRVPPLRERTTDIPLLAEHFLERIARESPFLETVLTPEGLGSLMEHDWPGNVRELENAVRYAAIRARGNPVECRHLPPSLDRRCAQGRSGRPGSGLDLAGVRQALRDTGGNRSEAAKRLGVSRTTLWRFLSTHAAADSAD